MGSRKRETVAGTHQTSGVTAEAIAEFIVHAVKNIEKQEQLIHEMVGVLEICLKCQGLNWAAEHDAEVVIRNAKLIAGLLPCLLTLVTIIKRPHSDEFI